MGQVLKRQLAILLAGFLLFCSGFLIRDCSARAQLAPLVKDIDHSYQEIEIQKNEIKSLNETVEWLNSNNDELAALVSELRDRPSEIRYIVKTETVIQPSEPIVITPDLPDEHLFTLDGSIPVARFGTSTEGYAFETYALSFRTSLALGERTTTALLQVQSSAQPDTWFEIPTSLDVTKVSDRRFFEPHIGIGITGVLPIPDLTASLYVSLLHPNQDLDLLQPRLSFNGKQLRIGIDPLSYNIGSRLPVLTDTWIAPGVSYGTNGFWSGDLTIGTKF
jgi:hypothetical protein